MVIILLACSLIGGLSGCTKDKPLTDQEKALIEKAVFDKENVTKAEESEVKRLVQENKYADQYWAEKKRELNRKDWDKKSTAKPLKDFP
jgi:Ser-tRNA(Ala) deacylase AlaX